MSPRRVWPIGGALRALAALALALSAATCRDAVGPRGTGAGQGRVVFAPILPSEAALASFGLAIDQVRIIVVRPRTPPDTLADTTVALPPDSAGLDLDLHVALLSSPETLSVSIIALSGTTPLFRGTSNVEVTSGPGVPAPADIPVNTYVGPGAGVDSIVVLPAAPFIYVSDSLRFQVQAFDSSGAPVTQFYVAWSTSDTAVAHINGFGVLRAPGTRSTVRVRARTPAGVGDSVTVTFVPLPTQLLSIAGGGQLAAPGQPLSTPLEVEVRASDNLPVGGVGVRFRSLSGGAPADTTVTAGADGRAKVTGVLGTTPGAQSFQASVPAFPTVTPITFSATAVGIISAATSTISTSAGSVASGSAVTLTLQGKDAAANNITTGGATVAFTFSGGASTGTIGATTDNGNGTYTATFTGVIAGAATTIGATINAAPVTTTAPTVTVTPGTISPATSTVSVSSDTISAGGTVTLTLQARDAAGNALTIGGATVAFTVSGGTSSGTVGATTDHANGAYTAIFTAVTAGTPATIGATIGASPVTTAHPSITVKAGVASAATSVLSVSRDTIASGAVVVLRLQAKDAAGNALTSGGEVVVFSRSGGTSTGVIGATADSGNGVYTATFTGVVAGTATTIGATINGAAVSTLAPTIAVKPGAIAGATSVVTASTDTLLSGAVATLRLRAKDAAGNLLTTGGDTVVFTASGGSSSGSIGAAADSGNGVYTATFTGLAAGTATTIHASANGSVVTTGLPLMTVLPGAASRLAFTVQPSPAFLGAAIAPAVEVTARDAFGNTTPAFTGSVGVAIGTNPGTGTLTGTLSHNAVAGVASFNDLKIDQPGIGYTLTASAGGLAGATSASFDVITAAGTIAWANAAGGNWSNPANWNGGVVPGPTDIALITLPGTYTVTFDVSDSIGGLQLGGSSGTQTLIVSSKTLGLAAGSQINANGVVSMASATLNGPGSITNAGQLFVQGTTALNGAIATAATSMIRVQGNGSFSTGNVTVASGFTNNGTIILTDTTSSYGAVLHVTSGTLTNAAGAVIDVRVGANGTRTLDAQLNNQGTLTVGHPFSLTKASAVHANSGTINVNAKLVIQQSGAAPSFTNSGAIAIGSTDTLAVTGGTFAYSGGTISGGAWTIASATVSASQDFSTATSVLSLTNSTWGGSGTLTIAPSTVLTVGATTISSALVNQGALTVGGTSAFNGAVSNAAGATLRVQGNGTYGAGNLTVANGFTNNGAIVLIDSTSSYGSLLTITTGALDNAAGGTIASNVGTLGTRSLNAVLQNAGTLTINHPLTLNKASAAHTNGGTINVGAKFTILQTGTAPSFTNSGSMSITSADTVAVSGGTFAYAAGAITGPGALAFNATTVNLTQDLNTAAVPFSLTTATVSGTGTLTVAPSTTLQIRSSTINSRLVNQGALDVHGTTAINDSLTNGSGATLRLQGDGSSGTSNLTVANNFTNSGAIVLTDTTSSYGAVLNMPAGARLTNAPGGTIDAAVGTAGPRTLGVEIDNQGTITLNRPLSISRAGAAHTNSGTINVSGGDLTLSQSGVTPSFTTSGTITIGAGRTFTVTSGAFNYGAGTINGSGTLAITSAAVTATQDFSTATTGLTLTNATWGGAGKLTVAAGTSLRVRASTINTGLVNQGAMDVHGTSAFNDSVTNASGATLRLQGDGGSGTSNLTVLNGFTNSGTLVLTDTTSSYGAVLNVTNGTLTNAAGATLRTDTGTVGPRTLNGQLDNVGTLAVLRALTISKASAAHVNRGTIDVHDKLTIAQSGTSPSFTQLGAVTMGAGDTIAVTSGSFVYDSGTINGGTLVISAATVSAAHDFSTATTALALTSATWGGTGTLTVAASTALRVSASNINAPFVNQGFVSTAGTSAFNGTVSNAAGATLRVQGNGSNGTGTLTVATGFTNNGTIALTDSTSSYGAVLNVTAGTLVNAVGGTIRADTGTGGPRTLNALLDNHGSFAVATDAAQTTTMSKASAAHQNDGTWTIASGTLSISGAGATFANLAGGTVQGAGIFRLVGIPFSNAGGVNPGTAGTGILKLVGNYTQAAGGALNIELGGTTAGTQYDRLVDSAGTVSLNGALNVTLVNGFTPALGDTFTVLTFPSRAGSIPTLNGLLLGGGVRLDTLWTATSLRLVAVVLQTVHAGDITASETWTAAASPHIVSGYLKIVNGATLTIEDGATAKFDAAAGLQVGDTGLAQPGGLVMLGTPGSIHLTANTASPAPGFWRGLEVQKTSGPLTWRNVDIEYAGGTRPSVIDESCVLLVDPSATIELDSVHIRQCIHAGIHHFAGTAHVHRSEIDSVTGAGIQSFAGVLRLDSTAIRGSGQLGLTFGNGSVDLAGAVANKFVGNAAGSVQMFGHQLPGFGRQDSIAGNGSGGVGDTIVVDSGTVGTGVPAFTIFRQPAPYLVTGFLTVGSASGVNVSLDTGLVMAFDTSAALSVGDFADSAGNTSGVSANLVSLGTAASPVVLRSRLGRPGWEGLFLGAQSGTPVVRHMRLVGGGYQPQLGQFCQNCEIKTAGFFEPLNATLYVDAPNGTAPFTIDSIVSDSSHFYGIVVKRAPPQGFRVRDNAIQHAAETGLVIRAGYNPLDTISGNTISGNQYAVDLVADVLPVFDGGANNLAGNVRDTLLLHGGTLSVADTLPQLGGGFRWRVTQPMVVDGGAAFTVLAGDTVVFDDLASLTIGGGSPSALHALGTPGAPILFTVKPGGLGWLGLEFANLSPSTVTNLIVESAGGTVPCGLIDCGPILVGAVRYSNASTSALTLDSVIIRRSRTMALDVKDVAQSPLTVQSSQFYENPFSPMIKSLSPLLLSIHGSDLYHYNGQIIQTANAGPDSIDALGNWWGDVGRLERGFEFNDSTGRGSLWFNAVRFDSLPGPHFPVGPAARIVPATDTVLAGIPAIQSPVGDPDSIRARVLDAEGRGVAGVTIGWGTSSGSFNHPGLPTDLGGRAGGVWQTTTAANLQFVQATVAGLIGSPVTWPAFLQPGPTVSVDFQLLQDHTAGLVAADSNSVSFTSSLRPAALVTNAHDVYGNVTAPQTGFFFTDVPANTGFRNYGLVDSVKSDTVFFHPTVSTPSSFQLHGTFLTGTGTVEDSVLINMGVVAAGMRLSADTAVYGSLCPVGGPYNILCRRTFAAFLIDSAGSPLPPDPAYHFSWTNSGTAVSDSTYGPMNEFADITAHANGADTIIVQQTLGPLLVPARDTVAITVNQVVANIAVTPDTTSAGLGDTVTFSATATDQGGAPMPGAVGWRLDPPTGPYLTIIDFPSANSVRVRLDSVYPSYPRDASVLTAFAERAPGDTLFGSGVLYNPIFLQRSGVAGAPQGSAVDPVLNQAYVVGLSGTLAVFDGVGDALIATIPVGSGAASVAANPRTGKVYVSNSADGTVTIIDGVSRSVITTIAVGKNTGGIAVDTVKNLVYVGSLINVAGADVPFLSTIDGSTDAVVTTDTVRLRGTSAPGAVAVSAASGRAFVIMRNDSLAVVDLVAKAVVDSMGNLGFNLGGVAVNTLTNRVYVGSANEIKVIDGTPGVDSVFTAVFLGANSAQGLSVNEARNKIYVAHSNNTLVYEIDGVSNQYRFIIVGTSISDTPQSTAVNPVTGKVYVPHQSALTVMRYFSH